MRYMPELPPNAVQTGVFARVVLGHNWSRSREGGRSLYGPGWMTLPILDSAERQRAMARTKSQQPDHWPNLFDYTVSAAADKINAALTPPKRATKAPLIKRTMIGVKPTDLIRACEIAGFIQKTVGIEHFVLMFQSHTDKSYDAEGGFIGARSIGITFEGLLAVAGPPDDFGAVEHALEKAERQFHDLPVEELSFLWDDLAWGNLLDKRDRDRLTSLPPAPPPVLSSHYQPYRPEEIRLNQPEPTKADNTIIDRVTGEETRLDRDPRVDDAFARLAAVMNIPPRSPT